MKCKSCGGNMRYDVSSYGLVCDSCGAKRTLHKPEEESVVEEKDFDSAIRDAKTDWGTERRTVTCKQCGAQMIYGSDQMSGICPYCGSAIVLGAEELNCGIAPNGIIPFTTTREEVERNYYKWNKFALWSPESFRKGKVLGNMVGVYVPYWTFDSDTITSYTGKFGFTSTYNSGDSTSAETTWYQKSGVADVFINDVCTCASKRFYNNDKLNRVVKFDAEDIIPYNPEALSGFAAEKYTIDIDEAWENVRPVIKKKIERAICDKERADCYDKMKLSTEYSNIKFRYFLFPVWLSACNYKCKTYYVVASGHDNRGLCDRPVSVVKILILILILLGLFSLPTMSFFIMLIISYFLR